MSQNRFYTLLSDAYDEIFPLRAPLKEFLGCYLDKDGRTLDLGSATGSLGCFCAKRVKEAIGIESNERLIELSHMKSHIKGVSVKFHHDSMLNLSDYVKTHSLDLITCLGNTLPHLHNDEELLSLFQQCKSALKPGAPLIIQLVNYDKVFSNEIKELPIIETPSYVFKRAYAFPAMGDVIDFSMALKSKASSKKLKAVTHLKPWRQHNVEYFLKAAGFKSISYYGSWAREPWSEQSDSIIVEAH